LLLLLLLLLLLHHHRCSVGQGFKFKFSSWQPCNSMLQYVRICIHDSRQTHTPPLSTFIEHLGGTPTVWRGALKEGPIILSTGACCAVVWLPGLAPFTVLWQCLIQV
jgi:hypothetical protein